jgi:hypothetical protein
MAFNGDINNNTTFLEHLFNKGIKCYGYEKIITIINYIYNNYKLPIISVGSGTCIIEYLSNKKYNEKYNKNMNWICIDSDNNPLNFPPQASYYLSRPLMNIDYNSSDELIQNNPSIVGNCILFLNWCLPNESTYDYDAIIKLKPLAVLSIYEVFNDDYGSAGGKKFYDWTINNDNYNLKEMYKLYYEDDELEYNEKIDIRIGWWQNNNIFNNDDAVIIHLPCMHYIRKSDNCSIS